MAGENPRWGERRIQGRVGGPVRYGLPGVIEIYGIFADRGQLLPSFLLERRLDVVEVIGEGVRRSVAGEGLPKIAAELGRPYSTVRDWRRRHRERAGELVAALAARAV